MMNMLPEGPFPILDPKYFNDFEILEVIEALLDTQTIPFIARNPTLSEKAYFDWIKEIDLVAKTLTFPYLMHHYFPTGTESNSIGVHLRSNQSVKEARTKLGKNILIGYSAHSLEEAMQAKWDGADYLFLGAIFPTPKDKTDHPILGLDVLKEACRKIDIPIYAIGGISEENLLAIRDAGAAGFSGFRLFTKNGDLEHNLSKLKIMWNEF